MSVENGDLSHIRKLGTVIKQFGYFKIAHVVLVILSTIIFASSITSIAQSGHTEEETFNMLIGSTRFFFYTILILEIAQILVLYRVYLQISAYKSSFNYYNDSLNRSKIALLVSLLVMVIRTIIFFFAFQSFLDELTRLAEGDATFEEFESKVNNTSAYDGIVGFLLIVSDGLLLFSFYSLKEWSEYLSKYIVEAFNKLFWGLVLEMVDALFSLSGGNFLGGLLGLIGFVLIIIGFISVGNAIERFRPYDKQSTTPDHRPKSNLSQDTETEFIFCPVCEHRNSSKSQYCSSCGSKLT